MRRRECRKKRDRKEKKKKKNRNETSVIGMYVKITETCTEPVCILVVATFAFTSELNDRHASLIHGAKITITRTGN